MTYRVMHASNPTIPRPSSFFSISIKIFYLGSTLFLQNPQNRLSHDALANLHLTSGGSVIITGQQSTSEVRFIANFSYPQEI